MDGSTDSRNFYVRVYLPLIRKNSVTHMHDLVLYVKERLSFARVLSLKNSQDFYLFSTANEFAFEVFKVHHKEWLNDSGAIDRPGAICYNFSISNAITQRVNFPTWIPDSDSHSLGLLDFFLSPGTSIILQWFCVHWEILIMLLFQFPLNFLLTEKWIPLIIARLLTIFHGRILGASATGTGFVKSGWN